MTDAFTLVCIVIVMIEWGSGKGLHADLKNFNRAPVCDVRMWDKIQRWRSQTAANLHHQKRGLTIIMIDAPLAIYPPDNVKISTNNERLVVKIEDTKWKTWITASTITMLPRALGIQVIVSFNNHIY